MMFSGGGEYTSSIGVVDNDDVDCDLVDDDDGNDNGHGVDIGDDNDGDNGYDDEETVRWWWRWQLQRCGLDIGLLAYIIKESFTTLTNIIPTIRVMMCEAYYLYIAFIILITCCIYDQSYSGA